ncbi:hypothetical protein W97_02794 [Coniosporium apollinis CBS 100218]|uniref:AB hydrolase-1 domain-containing protein n=1 Tax=Coniosporium apollinis (strain CBS 100218) TaxID=1168221 RepID=R7YPI7_CONA1|nr:uncharacterized protein W97_02794 [Coniosporium apollinis CBS 100218]EON63566.1 hypothetical protein W97_02794 [Coniosporium apollinis CBS 100218]
MSASAESGDDIRGRTQQSPLASQRARENVSAAPERRKGWFPLGYKEGFAQWWASLSPEKAEQTVLSFIPYLQKPPTHTETHSAPISPVASRVNVNEDIADGGRTVKTTSITDPYGPRRWHSTLVKLSGQNRALNEFSVERVGEEVENNLVMLHGYGAGLGFFYKNFEALSRAPGWKLYALDLLGMGRSSRPPFRLHAKDRQGKITEAENWFIDALEEWRIERNIERFTLLGHSLGGYMAVAYALKYPGRLNKLILASPVGIPEDPYAVAAEMPDGADSAAADQVTNDANTTVSDNNNFLNGRNRHSTSGTSTPTRKPEAPRRPYPPWLTYLWEKNLSPFSLVRWAGPLGPSLVSGWTSRRFGHLPAEEARALHDYSYSLFRQKGSGEYALAHILAPGAFARSPLIRRIQGVGRQYLAPHEGAMADAAGNERAGAAVGEGSSDKAMVGEGAQGRRASDAAKAASGRSRENGIPVVFMYGEHDWMDVRGGYAALEKIREEKRAALEGLDQKEREKDNGEAKVVIIRKAGHHVYLDGVDQFNEVMLQEMRDVAERERRAER